MDKRDILLGSSIAFGVKLLGAGTGFLVNIFVARHLSLDQAGIFFLAHTFFLLSSTVARLGTDNIIVRNTARLKSKNPFRLLPLLLTVSIVILASSTAIAALYFATHLVQQLFNTEGLTNHSVFLWFALALVPYNLFFCIAKFCQGLEQIAKASFCSSFGQVLILVVLLAYYPPSDAESAGRLFFMACSGNLLIAVIFIITSNLTAQILSRTNFMNQATSLLIPAIPLLLASLMTNLINSSSQIILGIYGQPEDNALFGAAMRISLLTSFILLAINTISAPKFAKLYHLEKTNELIRTLKFTTQLMTAIALPTCLTLCLFPDFFLGLFGPEYVRASSALVILTIGQFINVACGSVGQLLVMSGREKWVKNICLTSGLIAVILGYLLIPIYGVLGASYATAIAISCQSLMALYCAKLHIEVTLFSTQ